MLASPLRFQCKIWNEFPASHFSHKIVTSEPMVNKQENNFKASIMEFLWEDITTFDDQEPILTTHLSGVKFMKFIKLQIM